MFVTYEKKGRRTPTRANVRGHGGLLPFFPGPRMNGQTRLERHLAGYESSSTVMSSELETTSFCDSEDDDTMSR